MIPIIVGWYLLGVISYAAHCVTNGEILIGDIPVALFLGLFGVVVPMVLVTYSALDVAGELLQVPLWRRRRRD